MTAADDSAHSPAPLGSEPPRIAPEPPAAREKRSRWPGWIWAVPIAALMIVAWLIFKEFAARGPEIKVVFTGAEGVNPGQTEVQYQGIKVGEVEAAKLEKDLTHVRITIRMNSDMDGHLGPGTKFWIEGASLSNLASIKAVISGPTIEMLPRPGKTQDTYIGLNEPPVLTELVPGRQYVLQTGSLGSVSRGSSVFYHDLSVGKVDRITLEPDDRFKLIVFIDAKYERLVHDNTRFWNAGAVQLSMQPTGPQVRFQSVPAMLQGAIDFDTPKNDPGPVAAAQHLFTLYDDKDEAEYAPGPAAVAYKVVLAAESGTVAAGAPVELAGKQVGSVKSSTLEFDMQSGKLQQIVTITIEPWRIVLAGASWGNDPKEQMNAVLQRMIDEGLRAQLGSSVPMVGPKNIQLAFVSGAGPAKLEPGNPPVIPASSGGAGINGIMTALNHIAGKLDGVPLDQIADNIKIATGRLAQLSQSPQITASLDNLSRSLANVEQVTASAKTQLPALIASLRQVASNADNAVTSVQHLVSSASGKGPVGLKSAGLSETLYQVSRAAQAVRELADYLDRHPSALIRGRG